MLAWSPPRLATFKRVLGVYEWFLKPELHCAERVPRDEPVLFVMNHSLAGLEMPVMVHKLYVRACVHVQASATYTTEGA